MKHPLHTTVILITIFIIAQLVGLSLVNMSITQVEYNLTTNQTHLAHESTAIGERPDFEGMQSIFYLVGGVFIGTLLLLLLIKFRKPKLWKMWFFLAVWLSTSVAIGVLINHTIAIVLALIITYLKLYKPNPISHNLAEVLMYSGIAVLLVPIFTPWYAALMLLIISVYDAFAVWQSKHMIKLAKFQTKNKVFAGLMMPKKEIVHEKLKGKVPKAPPKPGKVKKGSAILGGGDVAFPLIFIGVLMEGLIVNGISKMAAYNYSLIVVATTTIALSLLFAYSKKDRFYPAMPFISAGCFIGWGIMMLLI